MMTPEKKKNYTKRVSVANPTELCVILYEIALDYLDEAKEMHAEKKRAEYRLALDWAKYAVKQLLDSVKDGQEISDTLRGLYGFCIAAIAKADAGNRIEPLDEAEKILMELKNAYEIISGRDNRGPVMGNAQTVYSGLTYGKSMQVQDVTDVDEKRGFLV